MDWRLQKGAIPKVAQFAFVIAKGHAAESRAFGDNWNQAERPFLCFR